MEVRKTRSIERNGQSGQIGEVEVRLAELERELEDTKRLNAAIFDASADGIAVFSPSGLCLKCNAAWKKATGLEGVGRTDGLGTPSPSWREIRNSNGWLPITSCLPSATAAYRWKKRSAACALAPRRSCRGSSTIRHSRQGWRSSRKG